MIGIVDRVCSVVVYRAVETEGALLFVPFVEMEKVVRSYCTSTVPYDKLRITPYSHNLD